MAPIAAGMLAGLIATAALSIAIVLAAALGIFPEFSMIAILAEASAGVLGTPRNLVVGWIEHLLIGTVLWGGLFALTNDLWQRGQVVRGIQFALIAWLLMMIFLMPAAGLGVFGRALGPGPAVSALVLHLFYGVVLGHYFGRFLSPVKAVRREWTAHSRPHTRPPTRRASSR